MPGERAMQSVLSWGLCLPHAMSAGHNAPIAKSLIGPAACGSLADIDTAASRTAAGARRAYVAAFWHVGVLLLLKRAVHEVEGSLADMCQVSTCCCCALAVNQGSA